MRKRRRNMTWAALTAVSISVLLLGLLLRWLPGDDDAPGPRAVDGDRPAVQAEADPAFDDYFSVGVHALKAGMADDARRMFEAAQGLRPHVPEVHVNLGVAHLALSNPAAAEAAFRRAIDLRPGQVNAYYGWAESLELLGDLPGALGAMRTYVHLAPEDDPFRTKALAALWEWEAKVSQPPEPASSPDHRTVLPAAAEREPGP